MDTDIYSEVTSVAGHDVTLQCLESIGKDVTWQYHKSPRYLPEYVYYIGTVLRPQLWLRFIVNRSISHQYDLNIARAKVTDSGKYICTEDGGQGINHVFQLRIIGILLFYLTVAIVSKVFMFSHLCL